MSEIILLCHVHASRGIVLALRFGDRSGHLLRIILLHGLGEVLSLATSSLDFDRSDDTLSIGLLKEIILRAEWISVVQIRIQVDHTACSVIYSLVMSLSSRCTFSALIW